MAENIAHFAVKSIGLSRVNGRKPCTLLEAARHNLREIQAEQGATGHIDPTRTHANTVLHGPATAAEVCAQAEALQTGAGIVRGSLRRDHCQAIEAVFSLPQQAAMADPAAYFAQCLAWLAGALALPVLSAVVHRDESATHLHVLLLPVKDGAHVGSAPIDRAALKRLRERFFAKVAGPAGLKHAGARFGQVERSSDTFREHLHKVFFIPLFDSVDDRRADDLSRLRVHKVATGSSGPYGLVFGLYLNALHVGVFVRRVDELSQVDRGVYIFALGHDIAHLFFARAKTR